MNNWKKDLEHCLKKFDYKREKVSGFEDTCYGYMDIKVLYVKELTDEDVVYIFLFEARKFFLVEWYRRKDKGDFNSKLHSRMYFTYENWEKGLKMFNDYWKTTTKEARK